MFQMSTRHCAQEMDKMGTRTDPPVNSLNLKLKINIKIVLHVLPQNLKAGLLGRNIVLFATIIITYYLRRLNCLPF